MTLPLVVIGHFAAIHKLKLDSDVDVMSQATKMVDVAVCDSLASLTAPGGWRGANTLRLEPESSKLAAMTFAQCRLLTNKPYSLRACFSDP